MFYIEQNINILKQTKNERIILFSKKMMIKVTLL